MSDLVEKLRKWASFGYGYEASSDMKEAAARIAQLEAALRKIAWTAHAGGFDGMDEYSALVAIRKATVSCLDMDEVNRRQRAALKKDRT